MKPEKLSFLLQVRSGANPGIYLEYIYVSIVSSATLLKRNYSSELLNSTCKNLASIGIFGLLLTFYYVVLMFTLMGILIVIAVQLF